MICSTGTYQFSAVKENTGKKEPVDYEEVVNFIRSALNHMG